jgi:hypothetical protein
MTKLTARILLICIILALAVLACVNGGDGNSSSTNSSSTNNSSPGSNVSPYGPDATATFGAEQFQIQLTAIANPSP